MRLNATGIKAPNKFPIHNIGKILSKHGPVLVHLPQFGTSGSDTNMKSIVAITIFLTVIFLLPWQHSGVRQKCSKELPLGSPLTTAKKALMPLTNVRMARDDDCSSTSVS